MTSYTKREALLEKINLISKEIEDIRQNLLGASLLDKKEGEEAWNNLMRLSEEISAKWEGPSAVEEIRNQRERGY